MQFETKNQPLLVFPREEKSLVTLCVDMFQFLHTLNAVESRKNRAPLFVRLLSNNKYCSSNVVNGNERFVALRKFS